MRPAVDAQTLTLLSACRQAVAELHEALAAVGDDAARAGELIGVLHVLEERVQQTYRALEQHALRR